MFERWTKPFICCFSDGDPITRGVDREFHERVPGAPRASRTPPLRGGHFLQADDAQRFAALVVDACRQSALG